MTREEAVKALPVPYSPIECYLHWLATGEKPDNTPKRPLKKEHQYLEFLATFGAANSVSVSTLLTTPVAEEATLSDKSKTAVK